MKKTIIVIEIGEIEVDKEYFSYEYEVTIARSNGKTKVQKGEINDDYENGDTPKQWKKTLEDGHAAQLVLNEIEIED